LPEPLSGEIEGAIGRDKRDRKRMAVVDRGGKFALTRYRIMRAWQTSIALVECRLATGRTHQIRVHFAAKGHPLVGDPVYLRRIPSVAKAPPRPTLTSQDRLGTPLASNTFSTGADRRRHDMQRLYGTSRAFFPLTIC
jgi:23S rRNA-/tRNA-specific pseudouridylate synthase